MSLTVYSFGAVKSADSAISGVGSHVSCTRYRVEQERVDLIHDEEGTIIVGSCGVEACDLIGGADRQAGCARSIIGA